MCFEIFSGERRFGAANRRNSRPYGNNREPGYGGSFDMMIVPEAANMPPTPWQTEILAPGI
jgi:hypothetical protein